MGSSPTKNKLNKIDVATGCLVAQFSTVECKNNELQIESHV